MIHIERLAIPDILSEKQEEWQRKYDEKLELDPKARPDSSKYAHRNIRLRLGECSSDKCFYCETKLLGGSAKEVDHFIEVAIDHSKAYLWDNLYLACTNCNDKADHNVIPVEIALNPCTDSDEEINRHICFEGDLVISQPDSTKGLNTIRKYHLNSDLLMLKRARHLNVISNLLFDIEHRMVEEGRREFTADERRKVQIFVQKDQPYSMMSRQYISKKCPEIL